MTDAHRGIEAAEQAAAMMTAAGMPRMPARVLMALIAAPAEGYTAAQLAERLGVSAAAVSGAVQYLLPIHMIRRISRPGDRRVRYTTSGDAWRAVVTGNIPLYGRLADAIAGIGAEQADDAVARERAEELAGFFRFLVTRMPDLIDEWAQSRRGGGAS